MKAYITNNCNEKVTTDKKQIFSSPSQEQPTKLKKETIDHFRTATNKEGGGGETTKINCDINKHIKFTSNLKTNESNSAPNKTL